MDVLRPLTLEAARADGITPYVNSRGEEFVQLHQRIPFAEYLYTSFERHYETDLVWYSHASIWHSLSSWYRSTWLPSTSVRSICTDPASSDLTPRYPLAWVNISFFLPSSFLPAFFCFSILLNCWQLRIAPRIIDISYCVVTGMHSCRFFFSGSHEDCARTSVQTWHSQLFYGDYFHESVDFMGRRRYRPLGSAIYFLENSRAHWYFFYRGSTASANFPSLVSPCDRPSVLLALIRNCAEALYFVAMNYSVHAISMVITVSWLWRWSPSGYHLSLSQLLKSVRWL